jgi:hypothetical protein
MNEYLLDLLVFGLGFLCGALFYSYLKQSAENEPNRDSQK